MPSTFFGLNIATSGILTAQAGLQTTAHNISNENTKGYSRQVVNAKAGEPLRVYQRYGMVGSGVDVTSIEQIRDSYYDVKYRANQSKVNEYETKEIYTLQIEDYFNELETNGFTAEFDNAFEALKSLQGNPSSLTYRTEFLNYCQSMADYLNDTQTKLAFLQRSLNTEVSNQVYKINNISDQIASLTKQINTVELTGAAANDLRDARELLLDDLAQIIPINVTETQGGNGATHYQVNVGGYTLVKDYDYHELLTIARETPNNEYDEPEMYDIYYYYDEVSGSRTRIDIQSMGLFGSLRATLDIRDGNNGTSADPLTAIDYKGVPFYYQKVQDFKKKLAEVFNDIHQNSREEVDGVTVPGNYNMYNKTTEDIPIFVISETGRLNVNKDLLDDPNLLAASSHPLQDGIDDSGLIDKFLKLQDAKEFRGGTAKEYLESIVTEISIDAKKAQTFQKNYDNIKTSIENQRMSISGVDGEEETMNLVRYQEAFELSSKMISVMAQLYDKLINQTGV